MFKTGLAFLSFGFMLFMLSYADGYNVFLGTGAFLVILLGGIIIVRHVPNLKD